MAAGFLDLIRSDLHTVDLKVEKAFKIKSGHLSKFAHVELISVQQYLHPALILFSGRIFGQSGDKLNHLAAVVQMIYVASCVQFRIPDENERSNKTGDLRDSAQLPVLVGDYLYGRYFTGLCEGDLLEFLSPLANIICLMNQGALLRKKQSGMQHANTDTALVIIAMETAALTEGAARLAGVLTGASGDQVTRLAGFGRNFGMAYGILERNLDPNLAQQYFTAALEELRELPAGEARNGLEEMVCRIHNGDLAVPPKKLGRSAEFSPEAAAGRGAGNED